MQWPVQQVAIATPEKTLYLQKRERKLKDCLLWNIDVKYEYCVCLGMNILMGSRYFEELVSLISLRNVSFYFPLIWLSILWGKTPYFRMQIIEYARVPLATVHWLPRRRHLCNYPPTPTVNKLDLYTFSAQVHLLYNVHTYLPTVYRMHIIKSKASIDLCVSPRLVLESRK